MNKKLEKIHNKIKVIAHEQKSYKLQKLYNDIHLHNDFIIDAIKLGFDEDWIILQLIKFGSWELVDNWYHPEQIKKEISYE